MVEVTVSDKHAGRILDALANLNIALDQYHAADVLMAACRHILGLRTYVPNRSTISSIKWE